MKQQLTPRLNRNESNVLIDGGMEIWPEGASRSVANNTSAYGAVLFKCNNTSSGITLTNSQQTSVPSNTNLVYSNQVSKTAAGSVASGTFTSLNYTVEGYDLKRIYKQDFSLVFWVKSSVASNRSVALKNIGSTHSYVRQYNIAATNTWQLVALSFPAMNTCPGTLDRTNGVGLNITFSIVVGSTFRTSTLNSWQSGNFLAGNGEDTTWLTGTNHDFSIAGAMLLPGDWSTLSSNTSAYEFVGAGVSGVDGNLWQKYYESTYQLGTTPGTVTTAGAESWAQATAVVNFFASRRYNVAKRIATPTITFYNPTTGASGTWRDSSGNNLVTTTSASSETGFSQSCVTAVAASLITGHWVSDARF